MVLEIRGRHLRYRVKKPKRGAKYRTHDVGSRGHSKRIAMRTKKGWQTQSWLFPISDIKKRRPKTIKLLSRLGIKKKAMKKVR